MPPFDVTHGRRVAGVIAVALLAAACSTSGSGASPASASAAPAAATSAAASAAATTVTAGTGTFHAVDGQAAGTAALLHLANDTFEVSLEGFSIASAAHLNVILVSNQDVTSTTDVDAKAILDLGPLKATTGMQEFPVPASMTSAAMGYHTVVLWDTDMKHAIAAAPLK